MKCHVLSNKGNTYMTQLVFRVPYSMGDNWLFYPIEGLSTSEFDMET